MAEGWGKDVLSDEWQVYSGGIEAHGINPKTIEVMKEVGIDTSNHTSNLIDNTTLNWSDLVVTLCSDANQNCPVLPPSAKREHWGFDDPTSRPWSELQRVRGRIETAIESFKTR